MKKELLLDFLGLFIVLLLTAIMMLLVGEQINSPQTVYNLCCDGYVCTDTYIEKGYCTLHECMINPLITNKTICKYKVVEGLEAI